MRQVRLPNRRAADRNRNRTTGAIASLITVIAVAIIGFSVLNIFVRRPPPMAPALIATSTPLPANTDFISLAENYFDAGNFSRAAIEYDKAIQLDPTNADLWLLSARAHMYAREFDAALEAIDTSVLLDGTSARPWSLRALTLDYAVRYPEAIEAANNALQRDPNDMLALAVLAKVYVDLDDLLAAQQYLARALLIDPNDLDVLRAEAYVTETVPLPDTGIPDFRAAIAIYNRINQEGPALGWIEMRLGLNYRVIGDLNNAIAAFERAAALWPTSADPYIGMSRVYIQVGDFDRARAVLMTAQELDPYNRDVYGRLGILEYRLDNYPEAFYYLACTIDGCYIEDLDITLPPGQLSRFTLEYYFDYGLILTELGDCDRGLPILDSTVNFAPGNATVLQVRDLGYNFCDRVPGQGGG